MDSTIAVGAPADQNAVLRWIVRLRIPIFALVGLYYVLAFNGQWRVGRDSALYRGVAHSLATGKGYTFRDSEERLVYPGMPYFLAGMQKVFGADVYRPWRELLVMNAAAVLSLVLIYRLVRRHFPAWVAVHVTVVMGVQWRFLMHANELMTDTPFVLAVCLALIGHDTLISGRRGWGAAGAVLTMAAGLTLAAVMRPTFWALAIAWCLASVWGIIRPGRRMANAVALVLILAVAAGFLAIDPRTDRPFQPFQGGYESDLLEKLDSVELGGVWARIIAMTEEHFPEAVFGTQLFPEPSRLLVRAGWAADRVPPLPGPNTLVSLAVLAGGVALGRRFPLWGLLVIVMAGMSLVTKSVPRYYLMIMPLLVLGWTIPLARLAARSRRRFAPELIMLAGLGLFTMSNAIMSAGTVLEQHGIGDRGRRGFLEVYRDGKMLPIVAMSERMRELADLKPPPKILGPEPRIMSYISGLVVYAPGDQINRRGTASPARQLEQQGFTFAIFPASAYARSDPARTLLADGGPIRPIEDPKNIDVKGLSLRRVSFRPPTTQKIHHD